MGRRTTLRASDSDREHIAERLREATVEGRLLAEEFEQRLERLFSSRTYGELDALVADLPPRALERRRSTSPVRWIAPAIAVAIVVPVVVAVLVTILFLAADIAAGWVVFMVIAWRFMAFRRGVCSARHSARLHPSRFGRTTAYWR